MEIKLDKFPISLKRINGWAGFYIRDGKKKPISLIDYRPVGANDFSRLVDFDTAAKALQEKRVDALGVSLKEQGITCVDLDCRSEEKREKYEEIKAEILSQFDSYAETSISGVGTHVFVKGKKPDGYKHCDKWGIVEVYDCTHFMVVTGNVIEGHDTYLAFCQEELNHLCEKYLLKKEDFKGLVGQGVYTKKDEEVLEKLKKFKKGKLFLDGKWEEIENWDKATGTYIKAFPSHSEADFSFASLILFLNGNNPDQALRIFLNSAMWDERRKAKKSSGYLQHTIAEASLRCSKVYDWDRLSYTSTEQNIDFDEVIRAYKNNELVVQAKQNTLSLTSDSILNSYLCKYIINFGGWKKDVISTLHGDYDSAANGARFWLLNQNDLIYQPDGDEWLAWNGKYWDRCYDKQLLMYAERVFTQLKHEAYNLFQRSILSVDDRDKLEMEALQVFDYASTSKGKKECLEMIAFSKSHFIQHQKEQKVDEKLHANANVINLQNGVFNLDDMTFYPHGKEFYQTKMAKVGYEENAECPLWTDFLKTVLPNEAVRRYLQKAMGYTISSGYMEKCMFVLYGENGNNGKTTITKTLYKLMGDYAVAAEKQTIMDTKGHNAGAPRPDLVRLRDRRYVCVSENEKDDKLAEGLIKNLTGGGVIICRTLHHEPIEFYPYFKIWLDTNYRPQVRGTDMALWRRLKVIEFNVTLEPEKIDLNFGEKLEKELPGILNWIIEGYRLYKSEGLEMPDDMQKAIKDYAEDMSPLDQWTQECVEYVPEGVRRCYTSKELYQSYYNWCKFNHEYGLGQRRFTQEVNMKNWFKATKKVKGYTQYLNVALNDIGRLFTEDVSDEAVFRKKYNEAVSHKIIAAETATADWENSFGQIHAKPPKA